MAAASLVAPAHAGTLHVRDSAHVLSPEAVAQLRSVVAAAPFDGRVAFTSEFSSVEELDRYTSSITEPGVVAVAVDPQHRQVRVHFGTVSRVPQSSYPAIERAGNDAFRRADWEGGAAAIFRAAAKSVGPAGAAPAEARPLAAERPSLFTPALFLVILAGAIGVAIYFARRRQAYDPQGPYGTMGPPPGYGPSPFPGPGYPGPTQGGLGPVGGGLIGAGLGGLAGYELGKLEGEREERGRDRAEDIAVSGDDRAGESGDGGGGGSSWDDDDGGFDSGGGGFDGGGDAGGGGSDFGA